MFITSIKFKDLPKSISEFENYLKRLVTKHKDKFKTDLVEIKLEYDFHWDKLTISMYTAGIHEFCRYKSDSVFEISYFYKIETDTFVFPYYINDVKSYEDYKHQLYELAHIIKDNNINYTILEKISEVYLKSYCNLNLFDERSQKHMAFIIKLINNSTFIKLTEELEEITRCLNGSTKT